MWGGRNAVGRPLRVTTHPVTPPVVKTSVTPPPRSSERWCPSIACPSTSPGAASARGHQWGSGGGVTRVCVGGEPKITRNYKKNCQKLDPNGLAEMASRSSTAGSGGATSTAAEPEVTLEDLIHAFVDPLVLSNLDVLARNSTPTGVEPRAAAAGRAGCATGLPRQDFAHRRAVEVCPCNRAGILAPMTVSLGAPWALLFLYVQSVPLRAAFSWVEPGASCSEARGAALSSLL